jgi:phenylalanyl-tRNA synthetase beta chain
MKISVNWLRDYVALGEKPQKIAEALTMGIAEVESVEEVGREFEGIVVGRVLKIKKHPNADELVLARVSIGKKILKIVCGAKNLKVGQKVPVALAGTTLPNGIKIEKVKIRGEEFEGMICSEIELGLGEGAKEIMVLGKKAGVGQEFRKYLGLKDYVLEIDNKSLTHRSDLFSHIGIARELAAILGRKLKLLSKLGIKGVRENTKVKSQVKLGVEVEDRKLCPRYMAVVLNGIKVGKSPLWIQNRLRACGVRPINNVVDITNYVMLEWGQPLHAFDLGKLKSKNEEEKNILVRLAKRGESITTIDGQRRKLNKDMLVIADSQRPIAIAGVMGGANTEVSEKTGFLILESASFDSVSVRKTSQKLGLRTEAVTRFEKGLGINLPEEGLLRCVELFQKYAKAEVASKIADTMTRKPKPIVVKLDLDYLNGLIGVGIPRTKVIKVLNSLEFKTEGTGKELKVEVPLFRTDVNIPEDVIEEVARIYGYDNVELKEITGVLRPTSELLDLYWGRKILEILTGGGFTETYNYSFYGEKLLKRCLLTAKDHVEIKNPLSEDLRFLRTSLLPRLFENVEKNKRYFNSFKLFEIGHVYFSGFECKSLAGVVLGDIDDVFYEVKGAVELLLGKLNIEFKFENLERTEGCEYWNIYAPGRSLQYVSGKDLLGTISLVDQKVLDNFDIENKKLAFFSLSLDHLVKKASSLVEYEPLSKFPPATLDLALVLDKTIPAKDVETLIYESGRPLLEQVELFDVYAGKPLAPSEKNLAFHLTYRAEDKTLEDEEVEEIQKKIIRDLEVKLGARVRE